MIEIINTSRESFALSENVSVIIDYGVIDDRFEDPFIGGFGRLDVKFRKSQLYIDQQLITEIIEDNPEYISLEEKKILIEKHIRLGEEPEKIINFPDGKTFKIEYWENPMSKGDNLGIYNAKYRKCFLFEKNGKLISKALESNPHYIDDDSPAEEYVLEDGFLD